MNETVFAVGVGYHFGFVPADKLEGIHTKYSGAIRFEGQNWNLFKATNYEDSRKIDALLDQYGEYAIEDYRIEPVIMHGSVEMTVPGFDRDRDTFLFGAYSFICNGQEIPIDFSGTSATIEQDGEKILLSFETGRTPFLKDYFLDDIYEDVYQEAGLRIHDITAEFLSKATSITDFMILIEVDGKEMSPEEICQQGSFKIKSLTFENDKSEFSVDENVIHKFNQTLDSNRKNSLSSIIESANEKCVNPQHTNDIRITDPIR